MSQLERSPLRKGQIRFLRVLRWPAVILIFLFLGKTVWENWAQVRGTPFIFNGPLLFFSTLVFAFSYFIQIWAWYLITLKLGIAIPFGATLSSWFYSQLGKYLPGKIWLLLSRFYFYESEGKSKKAISVALYIETMTMILASGLLFLAGLISSAGMRLPVLPGGAEWLMFLLPLAFVAIHPRICEKILNGILIRLGREAVGLSLSYADVLWVLFVCVLSWIVGGIGFYFFVISVVPVSFEFFPFLTGALAFSSTLGLVALFAPSGLGVREGVLVYLLSSLMPTAVAVIVSILTRLWMTLIEIGLIVMIYLMGKFPKGQTRKA